MYIYVYIHSLIGATSFPRPVEGVLGKCLELLRPAGGRGVRPTPALPPCRRCLRGTGGSLGLVAAAAAPKRGLMRPLLAFLKDRLCWWSRLDGATFQNTCQQDCGRRLNFVTMITYICQKKWRKTFENCQNICRKRVRIYFKIEAEIRAKETVSIHLLKYVRIHTSETGSQR